MELKTRTTEKTKRQNSKEHTKKRQLFFSMGHQQQQNGQFPLRDKPAGNHGSFINHLGSVHIYEYNDHDSLQARLIEGIAHLKKSQHDDKLH